MRSLNLDHLRAFAEIVALGSFSAAAERLNLTQPAVSLQIRQLERRLGLRLLERVGRRVQPTSAGRDLLPHIGRIDAAIAAAMTAMQQRANDIIGRVRLGTGATACIYLLPPVLRRLRRRYPGLDIVVSTGNTPDMLRLLEDNLVDAALVTLPAPGRMFAVTPIVDDEIVAVFAADAPDRVTAAVLAERPVVIYEPGGNSRRVVDEWFAAQGVALKPAMELGSIEAIKELVGAGLGCGLLPRLATRAAPLAGPIAARPLTPPLHRQLGLVLRRDKVPDPAVRAVLDALMALRDNPSPPLA